jgi:glycerol-3-phosphate dehydrogenase
MRSDTARASLPGGDLPDVEAEIHRATEICGDPLIATHLVHAYGSTWREVWGEDGSAPRMRERIVPDSDAIFGEVVHAAQREHARTIADVLIRRTPVAFETRDHGMSAVPEVAHMLAAELGWNASHEATAMAAYRSEIARLFSIDP